MLIIVCGIILALIIFFIGIRFSEDGSVTSTLVALILLVGIIVGLFVPVSGYSKWEPTKRVELVSLSNTTVGGSKGFIYVTVSSANVYTYRYEIDSEFGSQTSVEYRTSTVDGSKVIEVEDETITTPYLEIYKRAGKKSIWTFALGATEYQYVFYVPPGSISKDVNLK